MGLSDELGRCRKARRRGFEGSVSERGGFFRFGLFDKWIGRKRNVGGGVLAAPGVKLGALYRDFGGHYVSRNTPFGHREVA